MTKKSNPVELQETELENANGGLKDVIVTSVKSGRADKFRQSEERHLLGQDGQGCILS